MRIASLLAALAVLALVACSRRDPRPSASRESAATAPSVGVRAAQDTPLVLARGVRFLKAGSGDVAALVRAERDKIAAEGRDLVVYVGATWCEPCQRFHEAAQNGELDALFPNLTLLEFDLDESAERLAAAGYRSELIPLFAVPGDDGHASERRIEGGLKGARAAPNLARRLETLLAK